MAFSLEKFESYAYGRELELGVRELLALLQDLDSNYGRISDEFKASPLQSVDRQDADQHIWTRAAAAVTCLLSDQELTFSPQWEKSIITTHRWLSALFAATPFRNADHIMRAYNQREDKSDLSMVQLAEKDLLKFCWLYSPESEVNLDLDALWGHNPVLAAGLCIVLLSPRFLGSPIAHSKREIILPWLAERLGEVEDIELLPVGVLHDLYMHCSYADRADKHDIKKPINALICKKLHQHNLLDIQLDNFSTNNVSNKPVLLVVLEWFGSSHSIYRTHSLTIEGAKKHFHVIGMAYQHCVDSITQKVFDEFIPIDQSKGVIDQLAAIKDVALDRRAAICYMPSVGMFPLTMWLANLRVAPLQMMALGHPATSHAHAIDYVVVEEDYLGDKNCFSEELLVLPKDGMPYRPSESAKKIKFSGQISQNPEVVKIAVCSTTMKLNPQFLSACARIVNEASVPIHFKFLIGQAQGLIYPNVQRVVHQFLGDYVEVYPHQDYSSYMKIISECDMFINPFPFGNTNGIIDTVSSGLVGVCKTGPEVHEHIDEGIFKRLNLPEWLIAKTVDDYVNASIRLAENHEIRNCLRLLHGGVENISVMFQGRNEVMGEFMKETLQEKFNLKA
jgi:HMW1C N-terminal/HMW1 domain 2